MKSFCVLRLWFCYSSLQTIVALTADNLHKGCFHEFLKSKDGALFTLLRPKFLAFNTYLHKEWIWEVHYYLGNLNEKKPLTSQANRLKQQILEKENVHSDFLKVNVHSDFLNFPLPSQNRKTKVEPEKWPSLAI